MGNWIQLIFHRSKVNNFVVVSAIVSYRASKSARQWKRRRDKKEFSQKKFEPKIRAHKDRIYYSLESPEALDEPFMNSFKDDNLSSELVNYVSLILNFYNKLYINFLNIFAN